MRNKRFRVRPNLVGSGTVISPWEQGRGYDLSLELNVHIWIGIRNGIGILVMKDSMRIFATDRQGVLSITTTDGRRFLRG